MFLLLLLLWILLNGRLTLEIFLVGLVLVSVISSFMYKYLGYVPSEQGNYGKKIGWGVLYSGVLFVEVVKSGIAVLQFVLAKEVDIQPQIVMYRVPLKSELLKIVLANSITLTPGTITLQVEDDLFYVHAFDYTLGEDLIHSPMLKVLMRMEESLEEAEEKGGDYFG